MTDTDAPAISWPRLEARLAELARIGDTGDGGCSRLALTDADREGRDLVVSWMRELGLRVDVDGIGNVVGTWPADATEAPVLTGSHIDTVRTGGRYDGNLGVLAGLEAVETIITSGLELARPVAVAFFTGEEGSRFAPDMFGSLVYVGGLPLEEALDTVAVDGAVVGDELERIGYVGPLPCPARPPAAFVELHIEQGPVLEAEGDTIGAVTGVQGISWQEVTVTGQSNHAGTTPMDHRHDPAYVAAALAVFVRELADEAGPPQVATVGRVELHPNLVNVVPARATFTVDLRHTDDDALRAAEEAFAARADALAATEGVTVERRSLARFAPVEFDAGMVDRVERTARARGHSVRRMPSGAGHDAQMLARVCPTAMVFTPSVDGISHNPDEHTLPADLEAGAGVLFDVLVQLATEDDPWSDGAGPA
ncbi:Zn-dependent hydrolase [Iamia majanohamensis]|uniref:Zn-dependent hydrolase n=1 Tax=Iamia majanohamensis TaxID=467976 RepID=A0AAF0BS37_9ACTN|nr:Zn-dependent hydrolase [Iamia majanohamensis]WCO67656.1 Zn-dependent hydrolase [Iamia majanohamensis]